MLKYSKIDRDQSPVPWAAVQDAKMRNAIGITHFSAAEQRKAMSMMYALEMCYFFNNSYINWRDGGKSARPKFAVIKLEGPCHVRDSKTLDMLENDWQQPNSGIKRIEKRITPQGILYRVYF